MSWSPTLQPGVYRLSYTVQKENSEQETISAEFVMTELLYIASPQKNTKQYQ